ncbi:hypothetical protein FQR65_LT18738 [Abscondita terminalis]|nr:hypothetical protein FQR65_LT18738 [Abscondita terminalis]
MEVYRQNPYLPTDRPVFEKEKLHTLEKSKIVHIVLILPSADTGYVEDCACDMGQHYLDPVQYFLGKDEESPVSIEVDAPQQHNDAVGTWRRITYTYADGCQIILDGEGKDEGLAYIEGPKGKLYKGFVSDIPDLRKENVTISGNLHRRYKLPGVCENKTEICAE